MTAAKMYEILDAIDKRLAKQDRLIADLRAEIQNLYARLKR
jgi:hypothetical protein